MANPLPAVAQIGIAGNARAFGIPALAVKWVGIIAETGAAAPDNSTDHVLRVLSGLDKNMDSAVQVGTDNANEVCNINPTQRKAAVKFSFIVSADKQADVEVIAKDLPPKNSLINVGHMDAGNFVSGSATGAASATALDPQIETASAIVENASVRRSPEGAVSIEIDVTIHYNPDGSFKVFAALT
ncbi:MAG: hypothetical protein WCH99_08900 [Verrucomicrobiota bacterium]